MAEEKDTDSAPEDGVSESSAAPSSPRHGIGPVSPEEPDADTPESDDTDLDQSADPDDESDEDLEVPDELADEDADDEDPDDERELVGVGAASKSASRRSGGSANSGGRAKKDKPTPKRRGNTEKRQRMTPLEFTRGSISELKKVVWPTGSQLANYYVVVLIFVAVMIAIVMALDYGFGLLMLKVFA